MRFISLKKTGAYSRIAQDLVGRGMAYCLLDRDDEARSDLHRAAKMYREAGQESTLWHVWMNLAGSFEQSAPDSAAWYYDAALASLEHGNDAVGGSAQPSRGPGPRVSCITIPSTAGVAPCIGL